MADTIWKFPIPDEDRFTIDMHRRSYGAPPKILKVDKQLDETPTRKLTTPVMWAIVNPDAPLCTVIFHAVGTGEIIPADVGDYVGTFSPYRLVWHLFAKVV